MRATAGTSHPAADDILVAAARWSGLDPPVRLLGCRERLQADRLPEWRRRQWTAARLTARAALWHWSGEILPYEILSGADGAPAALAGATAADCVVSLSHCDEWAACAWGPPHRRVGVDIEREGACDAALLGRLSKPDEVPHAPSATLGWAYKEAAFKACRATPPLLRHYQITARDRVVARVPGQHDRVLRIWSAALPQTVLAVAVDDRTRPPNLVVLDAQAVVAALEKAPWP